MARKIAGGQRRPGAAMWREKPPAAICAAVVLLLACALPGHGAEATRPDPALGLEQCVAVALAANPAMELARQKVLEAREKIIEMKAGFYPSLKFSSSYTYTAPYVGRMGAIADTYDNRFSLRQTIYDAGATDSQVESARHGVRAQESEAGRTTLDIVQNVTTGFYETLKRRELMVVAQAALRAAAKHREQALALYKEGLSPRSDAIKADLQVSTARLDVLRAENALLAAQATLSAAMGLAADEAFEVGARGLDIGGESLPPLPM